MLREEALCGFMELPEYTQLQSGDGQISSERALLKTEAAKCAMMGVKVQVQHKVELPRSCEA